MEKALHKEMNKFKITMKKIQVVAAMLLVAVLATTSCQKRIHEVEVEDVENVEDIFAEAVPDSYYAYAQISVPAATETVYIQYKDKDGNTQTVTQRVYPEVAEPEGGKDVEPFGTVLLHFVSENPAKVSVYYVLASASKASSGDAAVTVLEDFPVDQFTAYMSEIGKVRYFMVDWHLTWKEENGVQVPVYPEDLVMYDKEHNHTLRYTFAYTSNAANSACFVLTDAYEVQDRMVVGVKYDYCDGCENCPYCMPWGCSCGCGGVNKDFVPSGDLTKAEPATKGTYIAPYADVSSTTVTLAEPRYYTGTEDEFTMYHSSGVVMFDDSWPNLPEAIGGGGHYDIDFNDLVVDYDIEAVTVADDFLKTSTHDEQLRVVLHIRALGGNSGWRAGLVLEGFDINNVESVDEYYTLDSWQNSKGALPAWAAATRFTENSVHYDPLNTAYNIKSYTRPAIEIGQLQVFNGKKYNSAGKDVYTYNNGHGDQDHVMNPGLKLWSAWKEPHTDQYSEKTLADAYSSPLSLEKIQTWGFYNTIPGYVNQGGGLYTYTVIYHMKNRSEMSATESARCLQNMKDAVTETTSQNFFMVNDDYTAVGLKGYQPLDYPVRTFSGTYKAKYDQVVKKNSNTLDPDNTYVARNGQVWAIKCPTLTRHAWEKIPFTKAYPEFEAWMNSNGSSNEDWYLHPDGVYISCWW